MLNFKNKFLNFIFFYLVNIILVWGMSSLAGGALKYTIDYKSLFFNTIVILFIFSLIFFNKFTMAISLILSILMACFFFHDINTNPEFAKQFAQIVDFSEEFLRFIAGRALWKPEYKTIIPYLLVILFSFTSVILNQYFSTLIFSCFIALLVIGLSLVSGESIHTPSFLMCVLGVLILFTKSLIDGKKGKVDTNEQFFSNFAILSFVIISLLLAHLLPKPQNGFKDSFIKTILEKPYVIIKDGLTPIFVPKHFSFSSTGYVGKDGSLGGNITLNDDIVMEVTGYNGIEPLHLKGKTWDKYTGHSWESSLEKNEISTIIDNSPNTELIERLFSNLIISLDYNELEYYAQYLENYGDQSLYYGDENDQVASTVPQFLFILKKLPFSTINSLTYSPREFVHIKDGYLTVQMQQGLFPLKRLEVDIKGQPTYSLFTTNMLAGLFENEQPLKIKIDETESYNSEKLLNKNSTYSLFYRTDPQQDALIYSSRKGIYKEILDKLLILHSEYDFNREQISAQLDPLMSEDMENIELFKMYPKDKDFYSDEKFVNYEDFLENILIPRAEEIYRNYTAVPDDFPDRVVKLTEDIVKDLDNDFLKVTKIENFLKNYKYSLTPGTIPEGRDFVDYFLFDNQVGYCTYFATSFVVMCRSLGIPARYVEGYITPHEREDNKHIIRNKSGHAWAEVYFEGYGWLTFDPTPPSNYNQDLALLANSEDYPINLENSSDTLQPENEKSDNIGAEDPITDESTTDNTPTKSDKEKELKKKIRKNNFRFNENILVSNFILSVIVFILIIVIYISIRLLTNILNLKKIKNSSNNDAGIFYYNRLIKYLKLLGYEKYDYQTSMAFAQEVKTEFVFTEENLTIQDLTDIYNKACYADQQISEIEKNTLYFALADIKEIIKSNKGELLYIYYLFVFILWRV